MENYGRDLMTDYLKKSIKIVSFVFIIVALVSCDQPNERLEENPGTETNTNIEFRTDGNVVQWRFDNDESWENGYDFSQDIENETDDIENVFVNDEGNLEVVYDDPDEEPTILTLPFYKVTFVDHDESIIDVQLVYEGEDALLPEDPERNNHIFLGWSSNPVSVQKDLSVYATYDPLDIIEDDNLDDNPMELDPANRYKSGLEPKMHLIEANPENGFNIPYFIYLPSTKHKVENEMYQNYLILEGMNNNIIGNDLNTMLYKNLVKGQRTHVVYDLQEKLHLPRIVPYLPKTNVRVEHDEYETEFGHFHGLDSTLIHLEDHIDSIESSSREDETDALPEGYLESLFDIDKQIHAMVEDAQSKLNTSGWNLEDEIFTAGFSASGGFAQRYTSMYPEQVKAMYAGGIFFPILPTDSYQGHDLIYQLGTYKYERLFGAPFDKEAFNDVAKVFYMGEGETIDSLEGRDTNTHLHREIVYDIYGTDSINTRWYNAQDIYFDVGGEGMFITDKTMRHETSQEVIDYLIDFFTMNRDSDVPLYTTETNHPQLVLHHNGIKYEDPDFEWDWPKVINYGMGTAFGDKEPTELFQQLQTHQLQNIDKTNMFEHDVKLNEYMIFLMHDNQSIKSLDNYFENVNLPVNGMEYYRDGEQKIIYIHQNTKEELLDFIENLQPDLLMEDFSDAKTID